MKSHPFQYVHISNNGNDFKFLYFSPLKVKKECAFISITFLHTWSTQYSVNTHNTSKWKCPQNHNKNQNIRTKETDKICLSRQMHDSNDYLKKINKAPVQWPEDREGQDVTELIEKSMFKEKIERLLL